MKAKVLLSILIFCFICSGCDKKETRPQPGPSPVKSLPSIAVWAFPDGPTVSGFINIGVVAYHRYGVSGVDFTINGSKTTVLKEERNPDSGEYEYYISINTELLTDNETYSVAAIVNSNKGDVYELSERTIQVDNSFLHNTIIINSKNGDDESGTGKIDSPYGTILKGLQSATGGDLILLQDGEYALEVNSDFDFSKFVTIAPYDKNANPVITSSVGPIRSSYIKFQNLYFNWTNTPTQNPDETITGDIISSYTSSHLWFDGCWFEGPAGKYNSYLRAMAYWGESTDITVENCRFTNVERAMVLVPDSIARNNTMESITSDIFNFGGENILISGNRIDNVQAPHLFIDSGNSGPYDISDSNSIIFNYRRDGMNDYFQINVEMAADNLSNASTNEIVASLMEDEGFNSELTAKNIENRLRIFSNQTNYIQHLYVSGNGNIPLSFSELSLETEAVGAGQHSDIVQFIAPVENIVIRNNKITNASAQGFEIQAHTTNFAVINNLFELSGSPFVFDFSYDNYPDKAPAERNNILIAFNTMWGSNTYTIHRSGPGYIKPTNFVMKNNIYGQRHSEGDLWDSGFDMDYNLYDLFNDYRFIKNSNSIVTNEDLNKPTQTEIFQHLSANYIEDFTNYKYWSFSGDFHLIENSPARDKGTDEFKINYDLEWMERDLAPDMGCYEFR